ncbi:hypothetical protein [Spirosoma gilvum]
MKASIVGIWLLVALGIVGCTKTTEVGPILDPKDDPLKEYTVDVQEAKAWLPGTWKLIKVYAMISNPAVPNVKLIINESQIRVLEDGNQIDKVDFELVKGGSSLGINTNAQPREDNWYVRNPGLYMNQKRMYLDLGRAMDGPAYEFYKVN